MSPRASSHLDDWREATPDRAAVVDTPAGMTLSSLPPGKSAAITRVSLEADLVRWLEAIGIGAGDRVTVLRRAAFGGPIHVRTQAGGEFAVDRTLAASIQLEDRPV